ncbi:hypothetical protein [Tritonibacter sp. AK171]|uniref:hypothetical protein n=1 Tax=Tritonibacter sp. AK171 TaxID=3048493 RepID=UPI0024C33D5F|nr:hypothetical protein [Tritonibacter sp. AK171]
MPVVGGADNSLEEHHFLGLAIKNIAGDQNHCGVLYRLDSGEIRMLHLAFHYDLRDEKLKPDYLCAPAGLEFENQLVVAAYASAIANSKPSIPYGFDANGMIFDDESGELLEAPAGKGLTCATFVLALFRTLGFEPLDEETWPTRDEDKQWQDQIMQAMMDAGASQNHIDAVINNGQSRRFRPEEVVGTSVTSYEEWAIGFDRAKVIAQEVLDDIAA